MISMSTKLTFLLLSLSLVCSSMAAETKQTYIVHMAQSRVPLSSEDRLLWFESSLQSVSASAEVLYAYSAAAHGFAARLTRDEAKSLAVRPGVVAVSPDSRYKLHTTRTPAFLGLDRSPNMFTESDSASDVVIGVLDTGVWPESKSFDDTGMGPVPATWRGACEEGTNFSVSNCNRKLIGAQ